MPPRSYKKTPEWKNLRRWIWTADLSAHISARNDGSLSWNDPEVVIESFGIEDPTDLMLTSLDNMLKARYADVTSILHILDTV